METVINKNDYLRLLTHYGVASQEGMTIEECAELITECSKLITECSKLITAIHHKARGRGTAEEIIEELSDVIIMTQQLRIAYGAEKVDNKIAEKLERQLERIRNERTV